MKKDPEQTKRTRNRIVEAFWKLYEERSINKITVKEIVAKAQCHRSTFYEYFNNVYEILEYIEDGLLRRLETGLDRIQEIPSDEDIITHQIETFEENGRFLSVLVSENGDPSFSKKIQELFISKVIPKVQTNLSNKHVEYISVYTSGGFAAIMTKWIRDNKTYSIEDLIMITHMFKKTEGMIMRGEIKLNLS